jgi:hypothetical protein
MTQTEGKEFWNRFIRAVGAEPREATTIKGASGIQHELLALGVDDKGKRIVLISSDHDPRGAAMMQVDVQSTFTDVRVVVARPIAIGLPILAQQLITFIGSNQLRLGRLSELLPGNADPAAATKWWEDRLNPVLHMAKRPFDQVPLSLLPQFLNAFRQLTLIDWQNIQDATDKTKIQDVVIDLRTLAQTDLLDADRGLGICAVPLYAFQETDWKTLKDGNADDVEECLRQMGLFQYFYPSPDHSALGLVDRGIRQLDQIREHLQVLPRIGHPLGSAEIVSNGDPIKIVDQLMDRGLVVEGEMGLEVSAEGNSFRATVRFKPREGVLSKVLNKVGITMNVNLK